MAFLGNTPTQQSFTPATDVFSGNGSTTSFTLSRPVASVAQIEAIIENVQQSPVDAYTVSGNTITFTSAPPTGTNNIYIRYTSLITQIIQPSDGTVGFSQLNSDIQRSTYGFKNRIINGDMRIDQRNAGSSYSTSVSAIYTLDRWFTQLSQLGKYTVQQNAGSVTPPAGFANYLGVTSSSAYTVLTADYFGISHAIEGLNTADLAWGTANAATVTLSFWVRSSLTGTFGGCLNNNGSSRSYPFTYTISSANTWEQKSITIAGDTAGTWLTTNGIGIRVLFALGVGATYSGTAGAWTSSGLLGATGCVSVVGTNGATFYVTGVQLEKGTTATSFDYRPYSTELALCQRYLPAFNSSGTFSSIGAGYAANTNGPQLIVPFSVPTRVAPTGITVSSASHITWASTGSAVASGAVFNIASVSCGAIALTATATSGQGGQGYFNNASGQILFTGCEL